MNIIIRNAEFTDIESIHTIEKESINSWTVNQFIDELKKTYSLVLICETDGHIAGYIAAWIISGEVQINSFAVEHASRRRGLGRALLDKLEEISAEKRSESIFLEVRSRNESAVKFYTVNGFSVTGMRKKYYLDDDALLMEKKLS